MSRDLRKAGWRPRSRRNRRRRRQNRTYPPCRPPVFLSPRLGFCEILARAARFRPLLALRARDLASFDCHKILKSGPRAFPKRRALVHTARTQGIWPRVAFSGSLRTEAAPSGVRQPFRLSKKGAQRFIAGWSSPVARQAHNLKVIGSNPIPATKLNIKTQHLMDCWVFVLGSNRRPNKIKGLVS